MTFSLDHTPFRDKLLTWFGKHKRDLPWRTTYSPYHVWISEIMLQQTQVDRGVEYFNRWIEQFPDIRSVASAPEQVILKAWEGLGYYSRARNIRKAAQVLVDEHGGQVPDDYDKLLSLPGIGLYTAAAIMSIVFNKPYPVVDANVERLFARLCDIDQPLKQKDVRQKIKKLAVILLPDKKARDFNQALMEFGALVCTPKSPKCSECPVLDHCQAKASGTVENRPVVGEKQKTIDIVMACTIILHNGKIFIQQRQEDDVWGGLWEFPGGRLKDGESPSQAAVRELNEETAFQAEKLSPFFTVTHYYTRYRVTLHSFFCEINGTLTPELNAATQYRWVTRDELDDYPFPSGHRQLIAKMKQSSS